MEYPEIEVEGYQIEPQYYFRRGANMLSDAFEKHRPDTLFYVAFEFRCAIEQVLRLYLELLEPEEWSKQLEKLYRAKNLRNKILEFEPEFYKKLEFVDLLVQSVGLKGVYQIDLDEMSTHYGKIGNFLHAQIKPAETVQNPKWWGQFYKVLQEAGRYLEATLSHDLAFMSMNEKGWDLYEKWKSGEYSDREVQNEFLKGIQNSDSV
jgi:hypothetical protein